MKEKEDRDRESQLRELRERANNPGAKIYYFSRGMWQPARWVVPWAPCTVVLPENDNKPESEK